MSPATRVVTGVDDRGRPRGEWRPLGLATTPVYGHMQPAYDSTSIERRKATPEELAAARAREEEPRHLTVSSMATPGIVVGHLPEPEPVPPSEETVSEPPTDIPETIPGDPHALLVRLADIAFDAREAHEAKQLADAAWDVAREALARAYAEVEWIVEPLPPQPDDDHTHFVLTVPLATTSTYSPPELAPETIGGGSGTAANGPGAAGGGPELAPSAGHRAAAGRAQADRGRPADGHDLPDDRRAARGGRQEGPAAGRADPVDAGSLREVRGRLR